MVMVTLTQEPITTQIVDASKSSPETRTFSKPLDASSNVSWLNHAIETQAIVSDGQDGIFVRPDQMQQGSLYPFMVGGAPLAALKQADGNVTLYGLPE